MRHGRPLSNMEALAFLAFVMCVTIAMAIDECSRAPAPEAAAEVR